MKKKFKPASPVEPGNEKEARIKLALENCAKIIEAEGVKYVLVAIDRNPKATDGGKIWAQMDLNGQDWVNVLAVAFPDKASIVNLGLYAGQLLTRYAKKPQTLQTESKPL